MKRTIILLAAVLLTAGCVDPLRWEPSEAEKQNVYLHLKTNEAAAIAASQQKAAAPLPELTAAAAQQSAAVLAYYGLPKKLPPTETVDELLSEANRKVTKDATKIAAERPDPWLLADGLLEAAIGIGGIIGGIGGAKVVKKLKTTREKTKALREVVQGNELYLRIHPDAAAEFKEVQGKVQSRTSAEAVRDVKS